MKQDLQSAMVRIAARDGSLVADLGAARAGRGGYLHPRAECLELFVKSKVKEFRSLRRPIARDARLAIVESIKDRLDRKPEVE
jgi:predicted RNA-binding protein YlxR (DUF448 family)